MLALLSQGLTGVGHGCQGSKARDGPLASQNNLNEGPRHAAARAGQSTATPLPASTSFRTTKTDPMRHHEICEPTSSEAYLRLPGCQVGTGSSESQSCKQAISAVLFHIRLTLRSTRSHTTTASLYTPLLAASETRECQTIGA